MKDIFHFVEKSYNLRNNSTQPAVQPKKQPKKQFNSVAIQQCSPLAYFGTGTIYPFLLKKSGLLLPCRLCEIYISNVGFV